MLFYFSQSATAYVLFYQRRSEGHKVSNGLLAELFSEEMCRLEAKFRPHDTDKGQEEGTNEEGNKEKAREESEQYEQGSYKEEREIDREQLEEDQARQGVENEMSKINMRKQNAVSKLISYVCDNCMYNISWHA